MLICILLIGSIYLITDLVTGGDTSLLPLRIIPLLLGLALTIYSIQSTVIRSLQNEIRKIEAENKILEIKSHAIDTLESHDAITGLPNYVFQNDRISAAVLRVKRNGGHLAIYRVRLGAATSNTLGSEEISDRQVIVQKARHIQSVLMDNNSVLHIGQTDFLIIAESIADLGDILLIHKQLEAALRTPVAMDDGSIATVLNNTAIAVYPFDGEDSTSLLESAENNLKSGLALSSISKSRLDASRPQRRDSATR